MLQCCESTERNYLFLSYFAVGKTFRAFLFDALKVGVTYQSLNLCYIYLLIKVHTEPFLLDSSFHRSLDTTLTLYYTNLFVVSIAYTIYSSKKDAAKADSPPLLQHPITPASSVHPATSPVWLHAPHLLHAIHQLAEVTSDHAAAYL